MRKITILCVSLALVAGMSSCGRNKKKAAQMDLIETIEDIVDMHNSRHSLDYKGTYEGVLPCADCPGIKTEVVLSEDTYILRRTYLERSETPFESSGKYIWDITGNKIILKGEEPHLHFLVAENMLVQLDLKGEKITGELAEYYKLKKVK